MSSSGFLVVTRKEREAIQITTPQGDIIEVAIVQVKSCKQVRVGVKCSKDFKIVRIEGISPRKDDGVRVPDLQRA